MPPSRDHNASFFSYPTQLVSVKEGAQTPVSNLESLPQGRSYIEIFALRFARAVVRFSVGRRCTFIDTQSVSLLCLMFAKEQVTQFGLGVLSNPRSNLPWLDCFLLLINSFLCNHGCYLVTKWCIVTIQDKHRPQIFATS